MKSRIGGKMGYKIIGVPTTVFNIWAWWGVEGTLRMPESLENYIYKLLLIGFKLEDISMSKEYRKEAKRQLIKSGLINVQMVKGNEHTLFGKGTHENFDFDLESKIVKHVDMIRLFDVPTQVKAKEIGSIIIKGIRKR